MNLLENLRTALSAIGTNKLRSLLTMLGVIIGVYAVATMMALGQMATDAITSQLNDIGGSQFYVSKKEDTASTSFRTFSDKDLEALSSLPLQNMSTVSDSVQMNTASRKGNVNIEGTQADYPAQSGLKLTRGRYFTEAEAQSGTPVIVLTESTAAKYFKQQNPIGQSIRLAQRVWNSSTNDWGQRRDVLTVIGVVGNQGGMFAGMAPDVGYLPIAYTWRYNYNRGEYPYLVLKMKPGADKERVQADLQRVLSAQRGGEDFSVESFDQYVDQFKSILSVLQVMLAGVGSLSLLVGGIGIMNIMLVSVTERTREIGLRKALGARKGTILGQFLIEAVTLTGIGGLIGYVLSVGTVFLMTLAMPSYFPQMALSPSVAALALGVSALIGLIFGVWPANRAAGLTPIEALRYE